MHYLTRQIAFEASHYYRVPELSDAENYALFGVTANPNSHGHNYVVEATVKGRLNPENGMVINITDLDEVLKDEVVAYYDHKHINIQHPTFANDPHLQPTSENLAIQIWYAIEPHLKGTSLHRIRLYEGTDGLSHESLRIQCITPIAQSTTQRCGKRGNLRQV
ncbi:6-carboxytetrahydropterin synthase [Candidatus Poribacteria bacterium]|nr:6-carboxytetrahydropterin synthase [Candidatus Poribacteria bacterium]